LVEEGAGGVVAWKMGCKITAALLEWYFFLGMLTTELLTWKIMLNVVTITKTLSRSPTYEYST
jgi:hypothetical protein